MDRSISNELYSETLKLSNGELGPGSQAYHIQTNPSGTELDDMSPADDNGSFWDSPEEHSSQLDLDREWQKRRAEFHNIGYRDGLTAGKEASAQEGFNEGFKESVLVGYNWGVVRGVTSALNCLPAGMRDKLVELHEDREKLQSLHQSVFSLSTNDALKSFHKSFRAKRREKLNDRAEVSDVAADPEDDANILENYSEELRSLIDETPKINVNFTANQ